jgi:rhamnopyranosyl-N-acetylglucosaminyl-diphospho-decaprenol beta-1,3/1,4-galactofuranosyltransferase
VGHQVVAVVVTWNRAALLERVLRALEAGTTKPGAVVVVDNASTDETPALLERLTDELATPMTIVRLDHNSGGAGGFHAGLAAAQELDGELFWLMDDDGEPEPDCLARLLEHMDDFDFVGPAVVAEGDVQQLCFPIRVPGTASALRSVADVDRAAEDGLLRDIVIPFNGVLISTALVERVGLPRSEFFIWGDDVEYLWRARRAGARVATVAAARFRHPATDDLGTPMMFGRTTYNHSPSDLKHYCMVRNNVTNLRQYVGMHGVLAFLLKTLWFYSFTRPSAARLRLSISALAAAMRRDFTGHERFIGPAVEQ